MGVSNDDLRRAQQIGSQGGTVKTTNMPAVDRNKIDAAVIKGQKG